MVSDFLGQGDSSISPLVMLSQVRETVELVENTHHVSRSVVMSVHCYRVWLRKVITAPVTYDHITSAPWTEISAVVLIWP
jgi:hypothetical protein